MRANISSHFYKKVAKKYHFFRVTKASISKVKYMTLEEEFLKDVVDEKIKSKKRTGINSKVKGNTSEREMAKILNERFKNYNFARSVQSGAYTGGSNAARAESLTEEQKLVFSGDIRVPKEFKFTIEHKFYKSISFWDLFNDSSDLHRWMLQAQTDADNVNKNPMLVCKFNNKKRIVFIHEEPYEPIFKHFNWNCYWLEDLLKLNDDFFFYKR